MQNPLDLVKKFHSHFRERTPFKTIPLFKALKAKCGEEIVDATCGTGKDSMLLLGRGLNIVAYERHPLVFALLQDALKRAKKSRYAPYFEKFKLVWGEAQNQTGAKCLYDPMYKNRWKQSSLPRGEMQLIRQWTGEDEDQEIVLANLMAAYTRVVLKRHAKSPFLSSPNYSIFGKMVRYDVYISTLKREKR